MSGEFLIRGSDIYMYIYDFYIIYCRGAAKDIPYLKRIGVTHVLNTAEGNRFGMVNTSREYYRKSDIKYMGVQILDLPCTNISVHFQETADFIENGLKSGGNYIILVFRRLCHLADFIHIE